MKTCMWKMDDGGWWHTECQHEFAFTEGTPVENDAKFCLYCGGALIEAPFVEDAA